MSKYSNHKKNVSFGSSLSRAHCFNHSSVVDFIFDQEKDSKKVEIALSFFVVPLQTSSYILDDNCWQPFPFAKVLMAYELLLSWDDYGRARPSGA